jgi:hypothetical protein
MVTVVAFVCADGSTVPPLYVYKGKKCQTAWFDPVQPDAAVTTTDSGWVDNEIGILALEHFDKQTRYKLVHDNQKRILIVDGHASHVSAEAVRYALANRIQIVTEPAGLSHLVQPLDVAVFGPTKHFYRQVCDDTTRTGGEVSKRMFMRCVLRLSASWTCS